MESTVRRKFKAILQQTTHLQISNAQQWRFGKCISFSQNRYFGLSILKFGIYSRFFGGVVVKNLGSSTDLTFHDHDNPTVEKKTTEPIQTAGFHKVGGQAASDLEAPIIPIQACFFFGGAASIFFLFSGVVLGGWYFFVLSFYGKFGQRLDSYTYFGSTQQDY